VRADRVATTQVGTYNRRRILQASQGNAQAEFSMEVQVFGVRKNADTRKALRFFSERRIRTHFVDLLEREIAAGELQRFIQRFGIDALIDRESNLFEEQGLRYAQVSPSRWVERLVAEPLLLRMPLVRRLGQPSGLTIGLDEDAWRQWLK
jgi:arsenate reductase-like glutaredoxin family protein